jgi:hypothetical protein
MCEGSIPRCSEGDCEFSRILQIITIARENRRFELLPVATEDRLTFNDEFCTFQRKTNKIPNLDRQQMDGVTLENAFSDFSWDFHTNT